MKAMKSLPQPFVTIYIGPTPELAIQDKAERPIPLKDEDDNDRGTLQSQIASLTVIDPSLSKFLIHKNLICYHSPFFAAAFNGSFIEGITQSMTLDVDEEAFGVLVNWSYSQCVVSKFGRRPCCDTLGRVWIMAERFMMPILQNQVMDVIYDLVRDSSPRVGPFGFTEFAHIAREHGDGDNQLVDIVAWLLRWCDEAKFTYYVDKLPQEIIVKVAKQLKKVMNPDVGKLISLKAPNFYVATEEERK
jgi:BTB/POZ domain